MEKIGYDGLIKTLKKYDYEPVGIHPPQNFFTHITAPNFRKKRNGKITLALPDDIFNNKEDTRQFNRGRYHMLILFVEDCRIEKEKKPGKNKKPTIIEITVKAMDDNGIEKEFYFNSMQELRDWWKNPYPCGHNSNKQ